MSAAPAMIRAVVAMPKVTACLVSGKRSWRSFLQLSRSIW
jgi:hypothetical protein